MQTPFAGRGVGGSPRTGDSESRSRNSPQSGLEHAARPEGDGPLAGPGEWVFAGGMDTTQGPCRMRLLCRLARGYIPVGCGLKFMKPLGLEVKNLIKHIFRHGMVAGT